MDEQQSEPDMEAPQPARETLRGVLKVYVAVVAMITVAIHLHRIIPPFYAVSGTVVAGIFLYVPAWLIWRDHQHLGMYGLTHRPLVRNLIFLFVLIAITFPPYVIGFAMYYSRICKIAVVGASFRRYKRMCRYFRGDILSASWRLPRNVGEHAISQLVVGISEEFFFRGYIQTKLERVWPGSRVLFGGSVGKAIWVTSLMFALGHLVANGDPYRLSVFFPSLIFGWMRSATGSVLPGAVYHAACNVLNRSCYRTFFGTSGR